MQDTTLTFASRRQIPTRYSRTLASTTLRAISRINEIRARRERVFYKHRMSGNKARALEAARKVVEMDEKYRMFVKNAEEGKEVTENELMALEEEDKEEEWLSSEEEESEEEKHKEKVKVPVVVKRRKNKQQMEIDE